MADEIFLVNSSSFQDVEISASLRAAPGIIVDFSQALEVTGTFVGEGSNLTQVSASYIVAGSNTTSSQAISSSWAPQQQNISVNIITASYISASGEMIVPEPTNVYDAVTKNYVDNLSQQSLDFYFRTGSAPQLDYYYMRRLTAPLDPTTTTITVNSVSASQYFLNYVSYNPIGATSLSQGRINIRYNMWFNAGGSRAITIAPELYISSSVDGLEHEIGIGTSQVLDGNSAASYIATVTLTSSVELAANDKLVCKFKAISTNSSPINVSNAVEGTTSAGVFVPVASSNFVLRSGDTMTGDLTAPGFSGSLYGTASNAVSSSWAPMPATSNSSSWASSSFTATSASFASKAFSSSYANTASIALFAITAPSNVFAGLTSTPTFVDNTSSFEFYVGSATVNLYSDVNGTGNVNNYPLLPITYSIPASSTASFIYAATNGVTASYGITSNFNDITMTNIVPVATVYRADEDIHWLDSVNEGLALANKIELRLLETQKFAWESGFTLVDTGSNQYIITAGQVWFGVTQISQDIFDSRLTQSINLPTEYFETHWAIHSASVWTIPTQSSGIYNNLYYDDGTNLVPLTNDYYCVNYFYRILGDNTVDHDTFIVMGNNEYADIVTAENDKAPSDVPTVLSDVGVLVGRMIVLSGSISASKVESAFTTQFGSSGATTLQHNSLIGLQGGQGGEYYHLTFNDYTGTGTGVIVKQNGATITQANITATGSLKGTSSYSNDSSFSISSSFASHSISSSWVPNLYPQVEQISSSWASASFVATSASFASRSISSSYVPNLYPQTEQISASWASASLSSSWSPNQGATTLITASTYPITASWADNVTSASWASASLSSSWSPNQGATTLVTASTYQVTASWANNSTVATSASWASQSLSSVTSSWSNNATVATSASWASHSLSSTTASWANNATSASWAPGGTSGTTLVTASTYQITSSWANNVTSASWSSASLSSATSSWANNATVATSASWASSSLTSVTASWSNNATVATSASWASASLSSVTASWANNATVATSASWASASLSSATSSWANNATVATSASWASASLSSVTASWSNNATVATSASWASSSLSSVTSSWSNNATVATSASWASASLTSATSSWANRATVATSASWASASFSSATASWADNATSASWAPGGTSGTTLVTASTYQITASWANNALVVTSASWASQSLSASWAPGGTVGTNNYVPFFVSNSLATTSSIFADVTKVAIGSASFDLLDPEVLVVYGNSLVDQNSIAGFYHTTNSFAQVIVQNRATGVTASGDWIAQSDVPIAQNVGYVDLGINNRGYADTVNFSINGPLDAYLIAVASGSTGGNLAIGCDTSGKSIQFTVGGFNTSNQIMQISDVGDDVQITGSLNVTAGITGSTTGQGLLFSKGGAFFDPSGIAGTASLSQSLTIWRAPFACTASVAWGFKYGGGIGTASLGVRKNLTLNLFTASMQVTQSNVWVRNNSLQNQNFVVGDSLDLLLITSSNFPYEVGYQIDFIRQ